MLQLASLLLVAGASAMPKADPQLIGAPLVPSLYHTQNCTNQEDTITTKSCVPVNNQECEDVEIPTQRIEVVNNCKVGFIVLIKTQDAYFCADHHRPTVWTGAS